MSSTGNVFPTVGANVDRAGSTAWTSPENVVSDNATDATVVVPSDYLVTSSYGFSSSVPLNVVIQGITVRVEASESGTGTSNYVPQLHSDTTPTLIGAAKGAVTVSGATKVISTTGGVGDVWGAAITAGMVRSTGFGVSIWSTDTINTLAVDFVTIAIEWTDVPNAWGDRQYFRKRRNVTNRRLVAVDHNGSYPAAASASNDRALEDGFRTHLIRSRRVLSIGWMAALTAQQVAVVPPITAWIVGQVARRKRTSYRLVVADHTAVERYTPPSIAWSDPPNVIRVSFGRKIVPQAPQIVFPPPTGPPVEYYPAWAARQLRKSSFERRALTEPPQPSYPATPEATSNDRALEAAFVTRKIRSRKLLRVIEVPVFAAPQTTPAVYPSFVPGPTFRRNGWRKHLADDANAQYPVTPPSSSPAVYPSFVPGPVFRREGWRKLLRVPQHNVYPATAVVQVTYAAVVAPKVSRRKPQARVLYGSVAAYEYAPGAAPYPSFKSPPLNKRRETKRKLRKELSTPVFPQTPAVQAQPEPAWRLKRAIRSEHTRKLLPQAWQITYPPTPSVGAQPEPAWRAVKANRIEQRRKLLPQASQIIYPRTMVPDVASTPVKALRRRETERKLRKGAHAPLYQPTPVPFQQPTAWKLAVAFRRHGWRQLREVLELDDPQAQDAVGYLVGTVQVRPALDASVAISSALEGQPTVSIGLHATISLKPPGDP